MYSQLLNRSAKNYCLVHEDLLVDKPTCTLAEANAKYHGHAHGSHCRPRTLVLAATTCAALVLLLLTHPQLSATHPHSFPFPGTGVHITTPTGAAQWRRLFVGTPMQLQPPRLSAPHAPQATTPEPEGQLEAGGPAASGLTGHSTDTAFPPTQQQAVTQETQSPPPLQPSDVDLVYLWVNGSDPLHQASLPFYNMLDRQQRSSTIMESGSSLARFNSDRDELRYSLRSVQQFMPWFRHLYIVTNGQVPSWLNISHPRVTVVPHSSIFERPREDLPTFNSHAIEANIHRIPGLSKAFIEMNDDFMLTAPWALTDFIRPDGAEIVYTDGPLDPCRPGRRCYRPDSLYAASLQYVDRLFLRFGSEQRYAPRHSPYFVQTAVMQQLQAHFPEQYRATSGHRFRDATDMQFAAAYKWYVAHQQRQQRSGDSFTVDGRSTLKFVMLQDSMIREFKAVKALTKAFDAPETRFVCVNDNTRYKGYLRNINAQVVSFLSERYPQPSEFELPAGTTNGCERWLSADFGSLPTMQAVAAACLGQRAFELSQDNTA